MQEKCSDSKDDIRCIAEELQLGLEAVLRCRAAFSFELSFHPAVCDPMRHRHRARAAENALTRAVGVVISCELGTLVATAGEEPR